MSVERDPNAPDPSTQTLLSVRDADDTPQTWVCTVCRWSEKALMQQRCPNCARLMRKVKE